MKGLKLSPIILAMLPLTGFAELKSLDDQMLSAVTGQAGLTIEITDASISIGEINYKDEGNIYLSNTELGGAGLAQARLGAAVTESERLDNIKMVIDVAGAAGDSAALESRWGLNKITDPAMVMSSLSTGTHGETAVTINDGDLVIGIDAIDQADMIDFGAFLERISLGASTLGAGEGLANPGTTIASELVVHGYLGPLDIVIGGPEGSMNINSYLEAEGEATIDFMATSLDFKFHNRRGDDVLIFDNTSNGESVSFFHAQAEIGGATAGTGLRVNLMDASGDIDLTNITLGTTPSIGNIYMTDLALSADMNVYGH